MFESGLTDEFRLTTYWFTQTDPSKQYAGTFSYNPRLGPSGEVVVGIINGKEDIRFSSGENLLGVSEYGQRITLAGQKVWFLTAGSAEVSRFRVDSSLGLLGDHYATDDSLHFSRVDVRYAGLSRWYGKPRLIVRTGQQGGGFQVTHEGDSSSPWVDIGPVRCRIETRLATPRQADFPHKIYLDPETSFIICADPPAHLNQFLDIIKGFQQFLTLGNAEIVHPLMISGHGPPPDRVPTKILIHGPLGAIDSKDWPPITYLFDYLDIEDQWRSLLSRWFQVRTELEPVIDFYFGALGLAHQFPRQRFLSFAQALESFHRLTIGGSKLPPAEWESIKERMADASGQSNRRWVAQKLQYMNEKSFRERLSEMYAPLRPIFHETSGDGGELVSSIVDTRNYLTHWDSALRSRAADGENLVTLSKHAQAILVFSILVRIGFQVDWISRLLQRHGLYKHVVMLK